MFFVMKLINNLQVPLAANGNLKILNDQSEIHLSSFFIQLNNEAQSATFPTDQSF